MAVKWKQRSADRGIFWGAYDRNGNLIGAIRWIYIASNNGAAFARNHHEGSVGLYATRCTDSGEVDVCYHSFTAVNRAEADKLAREYIKDSNLKALVADQ